MRLRRLPLTRKSVFSALSLAAAIGLVAVPASAATAPPPTPADTHVVATAPRPVDHNAAYFVGVAQGAAALAHGKVSTADIDVQIALVEQSQSMSVGDAQLLIDQLRAMTASLGAQVVSYDQVQAQKAAAAKAAAAKAAAAKAAQEAAARAAAAAQARQTGYQQSSAPAPAPASVGGGGGLSPDAARAYAQSLLGGYGWGASQFQCLNSLWNRESGWNYRAYNPSGAYGIPQALPGSKMGPGWQSDARVQIQWGLGYIRGSYGTPCGAWGHSQSTGWY